VRGEGREGDGTKNRADDDCMITPASPDKRPDARLFPQERQSVAQWGRARSLRIRRFMINVTSGDEPENYDSLIQPRNLNQGNLAAGFAGRDIIFIARADPGLSRSILNRGGSQMFSQIPVDFYKVKKDELNNVILRVAIMGEMDAINLYEQMAALTDNEDIRKVMLDIAKEEKAHVGEFQTLLLRLDQEQVEGLEQGKREVQALTGK